MSVNLKIVAILFGFVLAPLPLLICEASDVKIGYGWSVNPDETEAVKEAVAMLQKTITKPNLVVLFTESSYKNDEVISEYRYKSTNGAKVC